MDGHGLSDIEKLRKRLNCREGLLIDFDYAASLAEEKSASNERENETDSASAENQGDSAALQPSHAGNFKPSGARTVS